MNGSVNVPGASAADLAAVRQIAQNAAKTAGQAMDAVQQFAFKINTVPSQSGTLTYTGSEQSPAWNGYNPEQLTMGGVTAATNAGTFAATFTPVEPYVWADGSADPVTVNWTIDKAAINNTPAQSGTLTYTGSEQSPTWSNYDTGKLTLGGVTAATEAGTYAATFTPKANYKWADGTEAARTVNWTIERAAISLPSQSGTLTYTGSEQSPTWSGYDANKLTLGGVTAATNAGTYAAKFTPKANYKWTDGGTGEKTVNWTIGKAAGSLELSKTTMALNVGTVSDTITVTRPGNGEITATSSNTAVATVSVNGNTVTVSAAGPGNATITVSVAEGTNHTAPANKTCAATVTMPTTTLENNSWATIKEVSDAGQGENYWSVGDGKAITLNGTIGSLALSSQSITVFIIGFNHNSAKEGTNRIHFQIGKIDGKLVGLVDSLYNSSDTTSTNKFKMNQTNTNSGGWNGSLMRKTILGNSNTPTSPLTNSFMAALPSDLRAVMKSVTKYSDNTGGGSDTASYVTATTDYLFLLSEYEYHGARTYANSAEKNYQLQYSYYKAGNAKIHYKHNATGTAANTWTRSVTSSNAISFCLVGAGGTATATGAYHSYAVAPGFAA